ncbi:MAG: zinc metallopeptidase [Clostridia bacterium]|nr:zinc metallopeptidase [Clostridia bacterium]
MFGVYSYGYFNYIIYMLPALLLTVYAQIKVKTSFSKYQAVSSTRGFSAADIARQILADFGLSNVKVERVSGSLSDHFDPRTNVVRLSETVHDSTSISAIGVAAHEVGHAIQYASGYFPIKLRSFILPVCNFGSGISPFLLLFGLLFNMPALYFLGIATFSLVALFQLVTLPVEFNASNRALAILSQNKILYDEELKGAKKVLRAAALTYVAALLTSLLQIFYYLSRFQKNSRR